MPRRCAGCMYVMPDPPSRPLSLHRRYRLPVHVSNSAAAALLAAPTPNHDGDGDGEDGGEDGDGERRRATDCKGDIETFLVRPPDGAAREGRERKSDRLAKIPFYGSGAGRTGVSRPTSKRSSPETEVEEPP